MTTQERMIATLGLEAGAATWAAIRSHVEAGLPAQSFRAVALAYDLSNRRLARLVDIPARTIDRRIAERQRLRVDESDRLARVVRVLAGAEDLLGTKVAVDRWMSTPNPTLGGAKPIDELSTELGAREVEESLGRVAHGIFA